MVTDFTWARFLLALVISRPGFCSSTRVTAASPLIKICERDSKSSPFTNSFLPLVVTLVMVGPLRALPERLIFEMNDPRFDGIGGRIGMIALAVGKSAELVYPAT